MSAARFRPGGGSPTERILGQAALAGSVGRGAAGIAGSAEGVSDEEAGVAVISFNDWDFARRLTSPASQTRHGEARGLKWTVVA